MTSDRSEKPSKSSPKSARRAEREARLEAQLRANLLRRKDQMRRRAAAESVDAPQPAPSQAQED